MISKFSEIEIFTLIYKNGHNSLNFWAIIIIIIIKKSAKSNKVRLWKTKFNNNGNLLMNHVVAAAAGPELV